MSARPTLAEVRANVGRWSRDRQFDWAERAALIAEGCGCEQGEAEVMAWEQIVEVQRAFRWK